MRRYEPSSTRALGQVTRQIVDEAGDKIGKQAGNKAGMQDRALGLEYNKITDCHYILKRINTNRSLMN